VFDPDTIAPAIVVLKAVIPVIRQWTGPQPFIHFAESGENASRAASTSR
jgi:hypothetical protein